MARLMEELDFFYGASEVEPLSHRARTIFDELFGEVPAGHVLLAWDDDQLVGLAAYSYLWPAAGVSRSLFLKELYVAQSHRRRGFGKLLMQKLFAVAAEHGCSRVEWMTDADNGGAQRFYADLNVPVDASKLFYRAQVTATRTESEAQV